jgi:hypothetical protein
MSTEARSNIYKIVDNTRASNAPSAGPSNAAAVRARLMPFLTTPLRVLRWALYYVMMWIRPLVQWLTRAVAIPTAIIAVLAYVMDDGRRPNLPYIFAGVSFASFMFGWFYDTAILAIAPERVTLL